MKKEIQTSGLLFSFSSFRDWENNYEFKFENIFKEKNIRWQQIICIDQDGYIVNTNGFPELFGSNLKNAKYPIDAFEIKEK